MCRAYVIVGSGYKSGHQVKLMPKTHPLHQTVPIHMFPRACGREMGMKQMQPVAQLPPARRPHQPSKSSHQVDVCIHVTQVSRKCALLICQALFLSFLVLCLACAALLSLQYAAVISMHDEVFQAQACLSNRCKASQCNIVMWLLQQLVLPKSA